MEKYTYKELVYGLRDIQDLKLEKTFEELSEDEDECKWEENEDFHESGYDKRPYWLQKEYPHEDFKP